LAAFLTVALLLKPFEQEFHDSSKNPIVYSI
jgi:hypothetical protein